MRMSEHERGLGRHKPRYPRNIERGMTTSQRQEFNLHRLVAKLGENHPQERQERRRNALAHVLELMRGSGVDTSPFLKNEIPK